MKSLELFIPGEPKAKQRPQFSSLNKQGYTPQQTLNYENYVKMFIYHEWDASKITQWAANDPLFVFCTSFHSLPKSKMKKYDRMYGIFYPTTKPDIDNVMKIVLDSMNGIVFHDDSQIVGGLPFKKYAPPGSIPGVRIKLISVYDLNPSLLSLVV